MAQFDVKKHVLAGPNGQLEVPADDEVIHKFLMLQEGECDGPGPQAAADKFGFSKQRYFQLRTAFAKRGSQALQSQKRGPKTHYHRTPEVERQVIRHRFLDADASPQVIAQKLVQTGLKISLRSVERVLADYGLQKKTPQVSPGRKRRANRGADHP
jgi:transposase